MAQGTFAESLSSFAHRSLKRLRPICCWHRCYQNCLDVIQILSFNQKRREETPEVEIAISSLVGVGVNPVEESRRLTNVVWMILSVQHVHARSLQRINGALEAQSSPALSSTNIQKLSWPHRKESGNNSGFLGQLKSPLLHSFTSTWWCQFRI